MEGLEEDPAAAFLAREQDELADIADDTLGGLDSTAQTTEPPQPTDFFGGGIAEPEPSMPIEDSYSLPPDPYAAVSQMDAVPECILKWREEQSEMLAKKDQEEQAALEELRNQAKQEVQEWYGRHEEQLTQTKGLNRQVEAAFIEERDEDVPGHEWEHVARLCDFNPKNSKNTKDVGRMRSIFLQLKQTPLVRD